jgi:RNA polymerase sigma-70 factor (ECF subfamily)
MEGMGGRELSVGSAAPPGRPVGCCTIPRDPGAEAARASARHAEDVDTDRLIARIQGGDRDAFALLYVRYFDRVYSYLRLVLQRAHDAEDATQHVFARVIERLPAYDLGARQPFRAWLFTIARNHAIDQLRRGDRVETTDPEELDRRRDEAAEAPDAHDAELTALAWVTDRDLMVFIERLALAQRQVLALRYMLDLTFVEIAQILGRTPEDVRGLHHRAVRFLRARLVAVGRTPARPGSEVRARCRPRQARVLRVRRFMLIS